MMSHARQRSEAHMLDSNYNETLASGTGTVGTLVSPKSPMNMKHKQRIMSTRNAVRAKSMMPKNAINYYKLKKGLYLRKNSMGKVNSVSIDQSQYMASDEKAVAKSVGILTAYGEMAANINHKALLQQ
jgi:hypothetical protein